MAENKKTLAQKAPAAMTQDQRDQLAVDAMLTRLSPRGWAALRNYLHGCLDMAEELEAKGA